MIIESFLHRGVEEIYLTGKSRHVSQDLIKRIRVILEVLDSATSTEEVMTFVKFRPHRLAGDRAGQIALSVNGPWRITFEAGSEAGSIMRVDLVQYH
jgi:toxin HigB-1